MSVISPIPDEEIKKKVEELPPRSPFNAEDIGKRIQGAKDWFNSFWKNTTQSVPTPTPTPTPAWRVQYVLNPKTGEYDRVSSGEEAAKASPTPTPPAIYATEPTPTPTPASMFKKERIEQGKVGGLIKKYFPESEWQRVPVVLDGENGSRKFNLDIPNKDGSVDRGLMQINSKTFEDYWNRQGNKAGTYPLRDIMIRNGIRNFEDMKDPEKNMAMARIIWNIQGWSAWAGAPEKYWKGA